MEMLVNIVYYVIPFVVLLGILVFVHEFGHFIVARMCGVKVTAFSIGFGKAIWSRVDKKGTNWKISLIPLGGYCQFLGDEDASSSTTSEDLENKLSEEELKMAFPRQNNFKKLAIVLAGPAFNYLFAILIFSSIFYFFGKVTFPPIVGEVVVGGNAQKIGILANDHIQKINGHKIKTFSDITKEIELNVEENMAIEVLRGQEIINFSVPFEKTDFAGENGKTETKFMLGVSSKNTVELEYEKIGIFKAIENGAIETWDITHSTLRGLWQMLSAKRSGSDVGGVIRIAEMTGDVSKTGVFGFVIFMAILSINLGLINLFPIPALDGGHVVIYTIELIIRRELPLGVKDIMFKIGITLLISLMLFATWNDVARLINRFFN